MKILTPAEVNREKRIVLALACLFALVIVFLGVMSIIKGIHAGHSKQGMSITLDGDPARWMGALEACLGMLMLSIAMPTKEAALRWLAFWVVCFCAALTMLFSH